ncbi:MAG TPA: hypothetical protein VIH24_09865 [Candidatus Limnocylindria bacterium]|jgi:hypothetical protein
MDFGKLGQNEKLAAIGAIAAIVGPVLASAGFGFGAGGLTLLLAIAMLAIVLLPQFSPQTQLPGSKGSLMVIVGGIAAVSAGLALLSSIGYLAYFGSNIFSVLGWLIGIGGGLLMGWAGWQEFQSEGGKLQIGTGGAGAAGAGAAGAGAAGAGAAGAAAESAGDTAQAAATSASATATEAAHSTADAAQSTAGAAVDTAGDAAQSAGDAAQSAGDAVGDAAADPADDLRPPA